MFMGVPTKQCCDIVYTEKNTLHLKDNSVNNPCLRCFQGISEITVVLLKNVNGIYNHVA